MSFFDIPDRPDPDCGQDDSTPLKRVGRLADFNESVCDELESYWADLLTDVQVHLFKAAAHGDWLECERILQDVTYKLGESEYCDSMWDYHYEDLQQ